MTKYAVMIGGDLIETPEESYEAAVDVASNLSYEYEDSEILIMKLVPVARVDRVVTVKALLL